MPQEPALAPGATTALVRIPADDVMLEFAGELVGSASTEKPGKPRWVEIRLYKVSDGTGRYVLHRTGKSLAYHRLDAPCNRGVPVAASRLALNAMRCPECNPPELAVTRSMPGHQVSAESDHTAAVICTDATEAVSRLRLPNPMSAKASGSGLISGRYSAPAQRLLDEARQNDPDIAAALSQTRRI